MICPSPSRVDCCIKLSRRCPPVPRLIERLCCPPPWPTPILCLDHAAVRVSRVLLRGGVHSGSPVAVFSTSFSTAMVAVSTYEEKKAKLNFSFFSSSLSNRVDCLLIATPSRVYCCITAVYSTKASTTVAARKDRKENSDFFFSFLLSHPPPCLSVSSDGRLLHCLHRLIVVS